MISFIIGLVLIGLIAGFLARALLPGRDAMGIGATILLGIVGSFVGGFLGDLLFRDANVDDTAFHTAGIIGSTLGAIVCLVVYRLANGRRAIN